MTTGYAERYVAAVTRAVPAKAREDVAAELAASIADQVDERVAGGEAPESAERAVLVELGDPVVLAARYAERPLYLVGPRWYPAWGRLVRLLLWIVPACAAFGIAIARALEGAAVGEIVVSMLGVAITTGVHVAFWTTLVFVILERTGAGVAPGWDPDLLPEPEPRGAGRADTAASVVLCLALAGALLWDRFLGWGPGAARVLAPELWPVATGALLAVLALAIVLALAARRAGRWTLPLAAVNAVLSLGVGAGAIVLLLQGRLVHPELIALIPDADAVTVVGVVVAFGIAAVAIGSAADGVVKALRAR